MMFEIRGDPWNFLVMFGGNCREAKETQNCANSYYQTWLKSKKNHVYPSLGGWTGRPGMYILGWRPNT